MKYIQNFINSHSRFVGKKSNKGLARLARRSMTKGFTLLELLLVVAGIAILATLIFVVLNPATTIGKINDAKRATDVNTILFAMELFSIDNNGDVPNKFSTGWTTTDKIICTGTSTNFPSVDGAGECANGIGFTALLADSKFMFVVPKDPTTGSTVVPDGNSGYTAMIDVNGVVTITAIGSQAQLITAQGKFNPPLPPPPLDVDLVMSAVSTTATSVAVGTSFPINSAVTNNGTGPTVVATTIRFYLSSDANITGLAGSGDILLSGTRTVAAGLAAGATSSIVATTVTVPLATILGIYFIGAIADATNVQPETDETNNALAGGTITVVRDVDLVISALNTTATSVAVGTSFFIDNTETNSGTGPTVIANTIRFYLSVDNIITMADFLLTGTRSVPAGFVAGGNSSAITTVTVPLATPSGTYFIGAIADATNVQPETNEANNALEGVTITVP